MQVTTNKMITVLCAAKNSIYKEIEHVDVFDIDRDMRTFDRSTPVVAHPPCRAWSAYCAHQAKPLPGEKQLAIDAVDILRECGGVLEHPAHSRLWRHLSLPQPGWTARGDFWSMEVRQSWWGDTRTKKTWLLISKVAPMDLPEIPYRFHDPKGDRRRWQVMSSNQRSATCPGFANWLISVASQVTDVDK